MEAEDSSARKLGDGVSSEVDEASSSPGLSSRPGWWERVREVIAPTPGESKSLLAVATGVMSIAAVYLYFTGYMFALFYYRGFGVTLESLDVSTQYFFVSSYTVFRTAPGIVVFCVMALIVFGYASGFLRQWLLVGCLVGAFPLLFHTSYGVARRDVADKRGHPEAFVKFRFKAEDAKGGAEKVKDGGFSSQELTELGDQEQLFLLLETKDRIIVFHQPASSFMPAGVTPPVEVYTLLRSDLKWSVVTTQ